MRPRTPRWRWPLLPDDCGDSPVPRPPAPILRQKICAAVIFSASKNAANTAVSGHPWLALLGLGLVTQLGGHLALTYALGHLPATVTSIDSAVRLLCAGARAPRKRPRNSRH